MDHNICDCCTGKVKCKEPLHCEDIKTECIFVEKVSDSRILKTQQIIDCCPCPIKIDKEITEIVPNSLKIKCRVLKFSPITETLKINGKVVDICDYDNIVTGPGGMEQINLRGLDLDFKRCIEINKGIKVDVKQKVSIDCKVKIKVTGKGIVYDDRGCPCKVSFAGEDTIECCFENIRLNFENMCMPNNNAVFPVLIGDVCAANCKFDLDEAELISDCNCTSNQIKLDGDLIFCIKCEKKIKFPVELCVLSTGYCKSPETSIGCEEEDYPALFPIEFREEGCPSLDKAKKTVVEEKEKNKDRGCNNMY
jgi:hypothetical protein